MHFSTKIPLEKLLLCAFLTHLFYVCGPFIPFRGPLPAQARYSKNRQYLKNATNRMIMIRGRFDLGDVLRCYSGAY